MKKLNIDNYSMELHGRLRGVIKGMAESWGVIKKCHISFEYKNIAPCFF